MEHNAAEGGGKDTGTTSTGIAAAEPGDIYYYLKAVPDDYSPGGIGDCNVQYVYRKPPGVVPTKESSPVYASAEKLGGPSGSWWSQSTEKQVDGEIRIAMGQVVVSGNGHKEEPWYLGTALTCCDCNWLVQMVTEESSTKALNDVHTYWIQKYVNGSPGPETPFQLSSARSESENVLSFPPDGGLLCMASRVKANSTHFVLERVSGPRGVSVSC